MDAAADQDNFGDDTGAGGGGVGNNDYDDLGVGRVAGASGRGDDDNTFGGDGGDTLNGGEDGIGGGDGTGGEDEGVGAGLIGADAAADRAQRKRLRRRGKRGKVGKRARFPGQGGGSGEIVDRYR